MRDALRRDYHGEGLTESELAATAWEQARGWVDDAVYRSAERHDVPEPLAMSLATVDAAGRPDVRTVLLRFFDPSGPGFVSSLESAKGVQITGNPAVAAAIVWPAMYRAIRFRGVARQLRLGQALAVVVPAQRISHGTRLDWTDNGLKRRPAWRARKYP